MLLRGVAAMIRAPARVAVDGVTAAGKTMFADELAARLDGAARVSLDDFHRPPPQREYYPDSFDFDALRAHVVALDDEIVIVDGVFLHHPHLRDLWTFSIFLAVDRDIALERAYARDASWMENMRERYATRYVPGETRYLEECDPEACASVVIDNTDLDRPRLRPLTGRTP